MSLKYKMIGIMTAALVLYGIVDLHIFRFAVCPEFIEIERRGALADAARAQHALEREIQHLDMLCHDWASWDDTYDFAQTCSSQYVSANLPLDVFRDNQLHLIFILNSHREVVWGQCLDYVMAEKILLNDFPRAIIPENHPLLANGKWLASGLLNTECGPMLVASRPVLTSDNKGPAHGIMMMGRFLTEAYEKQLIAQTGVDFRFQDLMRTQGNHDRYRTSEQGISPDVPLVDDRDNDHLDVFAGFPGLGHNPGILIHVKKPRTITRKGASIMRFTVLSFFIAGAVLLALIGWLTQQTILGPIRRLTHHMLRVKETGDLSLRLGLERSDEIGTLGAQYDAMLALLQKKNRELAEDIDRRQAAEEALKKQQAVFRIITDTARDAIMMMDDDGRITFWNRAGADILGYNQTEVMGQDLHKLMVPLRFHTDSLKGLGRFRRTGEGSVIGKIVELMALHKDGYEVPVELSLAPARQDGRWHAVGILRDITQRKAAEKALRESEERYRRVLETVPNSITITAEEDGRYLEVNKFFTIISGYSREETLGRSPSDLNQFVDPDVRERLLKILQQTGEINDMEVQFRKRDGVVVDTLFSARRIRYAGKECIVSVVMDISERKKAEEERRLLATVVEQIPDLICIVDTQRRIEYVNPAFETLTGFSRESVVGKSVSVFKGDLHGRLPIRSIWGYLDKGKPWKGQMTNRHRDGTTFDVEAAISPVIDATGEVIKYVSVERDITENLKQERQLRRTQKLEAIGTLAGGVAHDFNNILSAILGFTGIAMMQIDQDSTARVSLQKVIAAANRAGDLVGQILAFSRKSEQENKPVLMWVVVKEALKLCRATIPSFIQIHQNFHSDLTVMGDPTQIHQMVMNLCTNAWHAMENDGGVLTVDLEDVSLDAEFLQHDPNVSPGTFVKFSVSDTGCGIAPENLERIFDPFFTTKKQGKGTGLGLSMVHGIVKGHGGVLKVDSQPGQGTTIVIYLPAIEAEAEEKNENKVDLPTGTERILFVDDETFIVEAAVELLSHLGYHVVTETDSRRALDRFQNAPRDFDLIMTDMTMPYLTGDALGKAILEIRPDIPVVLCTGFSERISQEQAKALGFRGFAMKPLEIHQIAGIIRAVLDGKEPPNAERPHSR